MQIEIRSRKGMAVKDELRAYAERRFEKLERMVPGFARLELEFRDEGDRSTPDHFAVDATLFMKGRTLRASDRSFDLKHAVRLVSEDLSRQVDKVAAKRRARRTAQRGTAKAMGAQPRRMSA